MYLKMSKFAKKKTSVYSSSSAWNSVEQSVQRRCYGSLLSLVLNFYLSVLGMQIDNDFGP